MIRAFQLIFDASGTWEKIDKDQQSVLVLSLFFLWPLMILSFGVEAFLLTHWGDRIGPLDRFSPVEWPLALRYVGVHLLLTVVILYGGAAMVMRIASSFHSRHNYRAAFTTLAYSLSPLLVMRIADGIPGFLTWLCYAIGILLSVSVLYKGIPRTLRPEPSNALGMYLFLSVFLIMATGLAHYVATLVLEERILANVVIPA